MHLGFHYHIPILNEGEGILKTPGYLGRFLDSLATQCDSLILFAHSPRSDEVSTMDYRLEQDNIQCLGIGPHASVPKRMLYSRRFSSPVRANRHQLDALLIRGPSPLLPAMAQAAGDVPVTLLIVGDYRAGVNDLPQPRWRKEAIRLWSYWNYRQQMAVARNSLTFVNSRQLYKQMVAHVPNLYETRTTTLTIEDFFERTDTCQSKPIRLLYTGRMDRAKGLFDMVEATARLTQQGQDVVLDLVGWPQKGDPILDELMLRARELVVAERIRYHGYKAVGPELFAYYQQADIYVTASQSTEGFPRTIWEALAHSLPVVATMVGAIPQFLDNRSSAVIVQPKNSKALAQAILEIITDQPLRTTLIKNGIQVAKSNTLEARTHEITDRIASWLTGP